jgi:hypothetical protein
VLPASQNIAVHRGAPWDARLTLPVDLPADQVAFIFLNALGAKVGEFYASPAVVVSGAGLVVDLALTATQVDVLYAAGAETYQLDVKTGSAEPRVLRGKIAWVQGIKPSWS